MIIKSVKALIGIGALAGVGFEEEKDLRNWITKKEKRSVVSNKVSGLNRIAIKDYENLSQQASSSDSSDNIHRVDDWLKASSSRDSEGVSWIIRFNCKGASDDQKSESSHSCIKIAEDELKQEDSPNIENTLPKLINALDKSSQAKDFGNFRVIAKWMRLVAALRMGIGSAIEDQFKFLIGIGSD